MQFKSYPSITNSCKGDFLDIIKLQHPNAIDQNNKWIVTEKIHGANFSLWSDGEKVMAAKRSGFIDGQESFYNYRQVVIKYGENVRKLAINLGKPIAVFGELFGDGVQKGIQYIPDQPKHDPINEFMAFDIYDVTGDYFLNYTDFLYACDGASIPRVPVIGVFNLDAALKVQNEFNSFIPRVLGYNDIENNICEGVVITPHDPLFIHNGSRVILKNKNSKFLESTKKEKPKEVESNLTPEVTNAIINIRSHITTNRLDNVVSKTGTEAKFGDVLVAFFDDAVKECPEVYSALAEGQQKAVRKALNHEICGLVRSKLYGASA